MKRERAEVIRTHNEGDTGGGGRRSTHSQGPREQRKKAGDVMCEIMT